MKHQIKKLQEYRANGIATHRGANVYDKLKGRREEFKKKTTILFDVLAHVQVCDTRVWDNVLNQLITVTLYIGHGKA